MLFYTILSYLVLSYAILSYPILFYSMLSYAIQFCSVQFCSITGTIIIYIQFFIIRHSDTKSCTPGRTWIGPQRQWRACGSILWRCWSLRGGTCHAQHPYPSPASERERERDGRREGREGGRERGGRERKEEEGGYRVRRRKETEKEMKDTEEGQRKRDRV
jgi:hypothetical protein